MSTSEREEIQLLQVSVRLLERQNAHLKRRAATKEITLPFLFSSMAAAVGFFVKVGVPVISKDWFSDKNELAARVVMYLFALCVVFPILGCVISNSVRNVRVLRALNLSKYEETEPPQEGEGNAVQKWWKNFTSPDNFVVNLCYYSISLLVAGFLCFVQYVAVRGIRELFSEIDQHRIEIIVGISIIIGILSATLGIMFSGALQNLLYHRPATLFPSTCFYVEKVKGIEAQNDSPAMQEGYRA
ncbi:hypothetical protein [Neorickettsia sennetsu]|uniref:Uncharacterized protein n=1 Tax=Ehrlichia sennetsu (strain ATCC VR-367 / Miyayama) TaxID=222891 RepID=Q2GE39_EHRS3|nr:hypothetical protein [Neorickettsia sennetsu]ABD46184.1 hypothetical protein NSE_0368 [Neorickettsia sennetsu str. Miyayama]